MTNEELLARIDKGSSSNDGTGWKLDPIPAALRYVVELCIRFENSQVNTDFLLDTIKGEFK